MHSHSSGIVVNNDSTYSHSSGIVDINDCMFAHSTDVVVNNDSATSHSREMADALNVLIKQRACQQYARSHSAGLF